MRIVAAVILTALLIPAVEASAGATGLGVMVGEPTGISLKVWTGRTSALDAAAGWSLGRHGWLYVHGDYLLHRQAFDSGDFEGEIPFYFGIGGRILLRDGSDSKLGIRFPIGLDYVFGNAPFDIFVEIAPILNVVPDTKLNLGGGVGVRYYF
jgi:hypothetical protein